MIIAAQSARRKKQLDGDSGVEKLELPGGRDPRSAVLEILLNPQVEFAEPNFLISKDDLTPDDDRFSEQWALHNTGQNGGRFGSDIDASGAWTTTTGSTSTVIAVVDSGIDFTHPTWQTIVGLIRRPAQPVICMAGTLSRTVRRSRTNRAMVLRSQASLPRRATTAWASAG